MNPYGNNGFNKINQQHKQTYAQTIYQQLMADPRYQQLMADPRLQQLIMDPRFQQLVMDPRFQQLITNLKFQQPMMNSMSQQTMQPMYGQPYKNTMAQQQNSFGRMNNPMQQQNSFNQIGERTISAAIEDVVVNNNPQSQTYRTTNTTPIKKEVRCQDLSPADGHEFPPYYDKDTERLEKVIDRNTCTYTWKIVKGGSNG